MKTKKRLAFSFGPVCAAIFLVTASPLAAIDLWWDGGTLDIEIDGDGISAGGSGTWNTFLLNWDEEADLGHVSWNNTYLDSAIFGGTSGTVTLSSGVTASKLTFDTAGYSIVGSTLTLAGAAPTIVTTQSASISSSIAGSVGFTKSGAGTLTLSNTGKNPYTSSTVVTGGKLKISRNQNLSDQGGWLFLDNAILEVTETMQLYATTDGDVRRVEFRNSAGIEVASGKTLTVGSTAVTGGNLDIVRGSGSLTKTGAGTLELLGSSVGNSYSGQTNINLGTVLIAGKNALGTFGGVGNGTVIAATGNSATGGILQLKGNVTSAENITITSGAGAAGYSRVVDNTGGNNILSGNVIFDNVASDHRLGAGSGTLTFSGTISQVTSKKNLVIATDANGIVIVNNAIANNGASVVLYGKGIVQLKGVSGSGIGNTGVAQNATLKLGVTDALNTSANLSLGPSSPNDDTDTFDLNGFNQTVNGLNGTAGLTIAKRIVTNSAAGTGTSTLTVGNGDGSGIFNGVIKNGATAKIALNKTGIGTQTLLGVNTYTGPTTVAQGTLALVGGSQTSAITVGSGASLGCTLGSPTTSTAAVDLTTGTVKITGAVDNSSDYLLITASNIVGTPVLHAAIPGYVLVKTAGDKELRLVKSASDPYATWSAGAPFDADGNNDGVSNGLAWILGASDPTVNALALLPAMEVQGGAMTFRFVRKQEMLATATALTIEVGTTLESWPNSYTVAENTPASSLGVTVEQNTPTVGHDTITLTLPLGPEGKKFARLKAVKN